MLFQGIAEDVQLSLHKVARVFDVMVVAMHPAIATASTSNSNGSNAGPMLPESSSTAATGASAARVEQQRGDVVHSVLLGLQDWIGRQGKDAGKGK